MICNICKDKMASIKLKEIIDDVVNELHLCRDCYEAREQEGDGVKETFSADIFDMSLGAGIKGFERKPALCAKCGTTEADFSEKARLGCGQCYEEFSQQLEPILTKIHGAVEHRGKIPHPAARNLDLKNELTRLQGELQDSISSEDYERAARLRDKIKHYESM